MPQGKKTGKKVYPNVKNNVDEDQVHFSSFEVKSIDEVKVDKQDMYRVTGYATKWFGIDSYGDQIRPGAYLETIAEAKANGGIPALFMHDSYEMPVGIWPEMKEDDVGLLVTCHLPKDDTFVSGRLIPQMKAKSVDALSIGFRALKVSFEEIEGDVIRILEKIHLKEISFITKGYQADKGALLTEIKKDSSKSRDNTITNALVEAKRKGCSDEVKNEIIEYYHEKGRLDPFDDESVLSVEDLKNLSKSNRVYAIRKLSLSAKASQHLAELMEVPKSAPTEGSEGVDVEDKGDTTEEATEDGEIPVDSEETEEESKSTHSALDKLILNLTKQ